MLTDSSYERKSDMPQLVAVIDIGATSLRMQIAQINQDGTVEKLEALSQAVSIGKDSFANQHIQRKTIEDCVQVLAIFRLKLKEYGVTNDRDIRVVATSGVREARNRQAFQDRIFVATGFDIEDFDEAELHRVTYLGILPYFKREPEYFTDRSAICEVGGGTTELMVLNGVDVEHSNSFRLGSLRLYKMLEAYDAPMETARVLLESKIHKTINDMNGVTDRTVRTFLSMGSEIRLVASELHQTPMTDQLVEVPLTQLESFTGKVFSMAPNRVASEFHLALPDAQTFGPALLTHLEIARAFGVDRIMVANVNLRDSLVKEMVSGMTWSDEILEQIVRAALQLGRKFDFDEPHSKHVSKIALRLFDKLQAQHQLGVRSRSILRLASLLHEIGRFISSSAFHKHSMYLIKNSDFFGVSESDLLKISLVARYHRRALPQPSHDGYSRLPRVDRVVVSKLAAILRIANAMDEAHEQTIQSFDCQVHGDRVIINVANLDDISMEQLSVKHAKGLFEDIYGMRVALQHGDVRKE